jgi:hypothetical protein
MLIRAFNLGSAAGTLTLAGMHFITLGNEWWLIAVALGLANMFIGSRAFIRADQQFQPGAQPLQSE